MSNEEAMQEFLNSLNENNGVKVDFEENDKVVLKYDLEYVLSTSEKELKGSLIMKWAQERTILTVVYDKMARYYPNKLVVSDGVDEFRSEKKHFEHINEENTKRKSKVLYSTDGII